MLQYNAVLTRNLCDVEKVRPELMLSRCPWPQIPPCAAKYVLVKSSSSASAILVGARGPDGQVGHVAQQAAYIIHDTGA